MKCLSRSALTIEAAVLAVVTLQCLADEPVNSRLRYGNDKVFQTSIRDARLLGQLSVKGQAPILIFSGRSNFPCARADCDSETNIYEEWGIQWPEHVEQSFIKVSGKLLR